MAIKSMGLTILKGPTSNLLNHLKRLDSLKLIFAGYILRYLTLLGSNPFPKEP